MTTANNALTADQMIQAIAIADRYGFSVSQVSDVVGKGRAWIETEVARVKADHRGTSPRAQAVIDMSRAAWKLAK